MWLFNIRVLLLVMGRIIILLGSIWFVSCVDVVGLLFDFG